MEPAHGRARPDLFVTEQLVAAAIAIVNPIRVVTSNLRVSVEWASLSYGESAMRLRNLQCQRPSHWPAFYEGDSGPDIDASLLERAYSNDANASGDSVKRRRCRPCPVATLASARR